MNLSDYCKNKVLMTLNGMSQLPENPNTTSEKMMYINDIEKAERMRLLEYRTWYEGDDDKIRMFYTRGETFSFFYEPFLDKNRREYFWSVSSTEKGYKCTHSGLPHIIIETLTNMIDYPDITSGFGIESVDKRIRDIEKSNSLKEMFKKVATPDVLQTGWGDFKISWNSRWSEHPIIQFYKAEDVDYIYIFGNRHIGTIYKDYYYYDSRAYVLIEERYLRPSRDKENNFDLCIEKEMFLLAPHDELVRLTKQEIEEKFPQLLDGIMNRVVVKDFDRLLSVPYIIFPADDGLHYGKSIFTGKISLFDDLDQCLSQASNTVRRSTPVVVVNTEYLERDKNGLPIVPASFDTKFVRFKSGKDSMGNINATNPMEVMQPQVNYESYTNQALDITEHILQGIMSPASLGIEISRKDNADAQREKEKVTVLTRNAILKPCAEMMRDLIEQSLMVDEYLTNVRNGSDNPKINCKEYNISVDFEEFADASFENKSQVLSNLYNAKVMSPEMFIEKFYKDTISEQDKKKEINFLYKQIAYEHPEETPQNQQAMAQAQAIAGGGGMPQDAGSAGGMAPAEAGAP